MKIAIVVAADSNIFPLAYGCFLSLQAIRSESIDAFFLDIGCTPEQKEALGSLADSVADFEHDKAVEPSGEDVRLYWKAQACRPFLPAYFPGYDVYIWLDSDTWVQDPTAITEMAETAAKHGAAIVPELDAAYGHQYDPNHPKHLIENKRKFVKAAYDERLADSLAYVPYLNTGVFALSASKGIFETFAQELKGVYQKGYSHMAEQICLNRILLVTGNFQALPAIYNWMCNYAEPMGGPEAGWMAPRPPFERLKVIHLCGKKKLQTFGPKGLLYGGGSYLKEIEPITQQSDGFYV